MCRYLRGAGRAPSGGGAGAPGGAPPVAALPRSPAAAPSMRAKKSSWAAPDGRRRRCAGMGGGVPQVAGMTNRAARCEMRMAPPPRARRLPSQVYAPASPLRADHPPRLSSRGSRSWQRCRQLDRFPLARPPAGAVECQSAGVAARTAKGECRPLREPAPPPAAWPPVGPLGVRGKTGERTCQRRPRGRKVPRSLRSVHRRWPGTGAPAVRASCYLSSSVGAAVSPLLRRGAFFRA